MNSEIKTNKVTSNDGVVQISPEAGASLVVNIDGDMQCEQITTPDNPPTGYTSLYFKNDNILYKKTSAGVESAIGAAGMAPANDSDGVVNNAILQISGTDPATCKTRNSGQLPLLWDSSTGTLQRFGGNAINLGGSTVTFSGVAGGAGKFFSNGGTPAVGTSNANFAFVDNVCIGVYSHLAPDGTYYLGAYNSGGIKNSKFESGLFAKGLILGTSDARGTAVSTLPVAGEIIVPTGTNLTLNADRVIIKNSVTPASASATGVAGTVCWDADYIYVCTAADTWKRAAIATW